MIQFFEHATTPRPRREDLIGRIVCKEGTNYWRSVAAPVRVTGLLAAKSLIGHSVRLRLMQEGDDHPSYYIPEESSLDRELQSENNHTIALKSVFCVCDTMNELAQLLNQNLRARAEFVRFKKQQNDGLFSLDGAGFREARLSCPGHTFAQVPK